MFRDQVIWALKTKGISKSIWFLLKCGLKLLNAHPVQSRIQPKDGGNNPSENGFLAKGRERGSIQTTKWRWTRGSATRSSVRSLDSKELVPPSQERNESLQQSSSESTAADQLLDHSHLHTPSQGSSTNHILTK